MIWIILLLLIILILAAKKKNNKTTVKLSDELHNEQTNETYLAFHFVLTNIQTRLTVINDTVVLTTLSQLKTGLSIQTRTYKIENDCFKVKDETNNIDISIKMEDILATKRTEQHNNHILYLCWIDGTINNNYYTLSITFANYYPQTALPLIKYLR
jgi:hypothetical protein